MVDGTLLSIFERTYADTELAEALHVYNWGFDDGGLYWGAVIVPSSDIRRHLRLRIGSTNSPTAAVSPATSPVQLADDVQWVGSVVNIKMPGFGDSRATDGEDGLDLEIIELTKKFYEYFPDAYDSIAFIPQSQGFASYGAVHLNVKNDVTGIGLSTFDNSADYGSEGGTLKSIEFYPQTAFTTHEASNHEIMHQWGNYLDLVGIAGVDGKGHEPSAHTPLTEGATLLGAALEATRTVSGVTQTQTLEGSDFEIIETPRPLSLSSTGDVRAGENPDRGARHAAHLR